MLNKKEKIIHTLIGVSLFMFAFFSVFGNIFGKFEKVEDEVVLIEDQNPKEEVVDVVKETVPEPVIVKTTNNNTAPVKIETKTDSTPVASGYSLSGVAIHNSAKSCWSAVNGSVYDLTEWVNDHPGGKAAILMICGKDGSALYNSQHGRSSRIKNMLEDFKIGSLVS